MESSDKWTCSECGFRNSANNLVCGGRGNLGCKASRELSSPDIVYQTEAIPTAAVYPQIIVESPSTDGKTWNCESCGFRNVAKNEVCGGRGTLGCKAEKPKVMY